MNRPIRRLWRKTIRSLDIRNASPQQTSCHRTAKANGTRPMCGIRKRFRRTTPPRSLKPAPDQPALTTSSSRRGEVDLHQSRLPATRSHHVFPRQPLLIATGAGVLTGLLIVLGTAYTENEAGSERGPATAVTSSAPRPKHHHTVPGDPTPKTVSE